jgi:putative endonuclease
LDEHNNAQYKDAYTSKGIPWELKLSILCNSSEEAYRLEAFIKRMKSRIFIEKLLASDALVEEIKVKLRS